MFRKNISILFLIALCFFADRLNAQSIKYKIIVDTPEFSISIDSSTITLFKDIKEKLLWLDILSRDTILYSTLKHRYKDEAAYITVLKITELTKESSEYEFEILVRSKPMPIEILNDSLPIRHLPRRPFYYNVKLSGVRGTVNSKITKVEYSYSEL